VKPLHSLIQKRPAVPALVYTVLAFARRRGGVAVVEFAVLVPVLLLVVFGILDFGRSMNYMNDATHLASEGARFAVVNRNPGGGTSLQDWVKSQADTGELQDHAQVCIAFPSGSSQLGQPVKVTVTFTFNWLNFIGNAVGGSSSDFTSSSTMRIEQPPTNYNVGCSS
jgi:Flp pilus assembly protein TadG